MKRIGLVLLVITVLISFSFIDTMAQPGPPKGLRIVQDCCLVIVNDTSMIWEISLNGVVLGAVNSWAKFEEAIRCPSKNFDVILKSINKSGITITKYFNANEKTPENRFIWILSR